MFNSIPKLRDVDFRNGIPDGCHVPPDYEYVDGSLVRSDGVKGLFVWDSLGRVWRFTRDHEADFARDMRALAIPCVVNDETYVDIVPVVKSKCDVCGFVVNPVGHAARCSPTGRAGAGVATVSSDVLRVMAWLGDADHTSDVRRFLVATGVPVAMLEAESQKYRSNAAQAKYYRSYDGDKVPSPGTSDHSLSTAFEAGYSGLFRRKYLASQLVAVRYDFDPAASEFFGTFPYGV